MTPLDDLFSTDESRAESQLEKVVTLTPADISDFPNHPFKVKDDEAMLETADSIRQYGVLVPAIARPDPDGGYELVAGHRRHRASELAEKETMPVIVRDLDDDAATIIMVDSNLQRESLLPSERALLQLRRAVRPSGVRRSGADPGGIGGTPQERGTQGQTASELLEAQSQRKTSSLREQNQGQA